MPTPRDLSIPASLALLFLAAGCPTGADDDDTPAPDDDDTPAPDDDDTGSDDDDTVDDDDTGDDDDDSTPPPPDRLEGWIFARNTDANTWTIHVVDIERTPALGATVTSFDVTDLADLSGPVESGGNGAGPSWGDAIISPDGTRFFANARSVNRIAVFDVENRELETMLPAGGALVHIYNPNHNGEIWSHSDTEGAFYVVDATTLAVSKPVVAADEATGHGKLLYASALGTDYYATNTSDPGVFPVDGAARTAGARIPLCAAPCEDDPNTIDVDESLLTCGGTHDKGFDPALGLAFFQCSGVTGGTYAWVDPDDNTVVADLVPLVGGVSGSPGWTYTAIVDGTDGQVKIWDTTAPGHTREAFEQTVAVGDGPSDRGTIWVEGVEGWRAWVPQNSGTKAVAISPTDGQVAEVELGTVTLPTSGHASRRAAGGAGVYLTYSDAGIVLVDVDTEEVLTIPATLDRVDRIEARIVGGK